MKVTLINLYNFNLLYAKELVRDVEDNSMAVSPGNGLENHPAFTLGHLISAAAMTSEELGGPYEFNTEWEELFRRNGPGDPRKPATGSDLYPHKDELLSELTRQHEIVAKLIRGLDDERFTEPAEWRFDKYFPTFGDLIYFMCITHEAMHLSQLASWRRAMGLPSALAKL
jgi:hypothetical protein